MRSRLFGYQSAIAKFPAAITPDARQIDPEIGFGITPVIAQLGMETADQKFPQPPASYPPLTTSILLYSMIFIKTP